MICPVLLTREVSALKKAAGTLVGRKGRGEGADDEVTRRVVEGHGREDELVGCLDTRHSRVYIYLTLLCR